MFICVDMSTLVFDKVIYVPAVPEGTEHVFTVPEGEGNLYFEHYDGIVGNLYHLYFAKDRSPTFMDYDYYRALWDDSDHNGIGKLEPGKWYLVITADPEAGDIHLKLSLIHI